MSDEQKEAEAQARIDALAKKQAELDAQNAKRTGKGTRVACGYTRGKNPQLVVWEEFDLQSPATLPADTSEFLELTGIGGDEKRLLKVLFSGYNDEQRDLASDPIAEFVESSWPDEIQKNFRMAVRNYLPMVDSLDEAVKLIKPGVVAKYGPKA